ncbi:3-deoxy-D-manno-octulosonic acid transferase [Roseococcus sp. SYP-B2431]|uniref:3-deoxy-D-manno-octulosonic acid transferase n=1 Tax=Roseococcus sp. SYP-B2431 TaxID=2496640 RepID=UPI00103E6670|nr:3-deoxy-D-manno-octulosonic acid transferase [Roseococcus sp. SYP-B2431]TCH96722.1 3-deoxy-D-manno-octulosonic acid transferase [Roseococcus sp. SYP-B2431]
MSRIWHLAATLAVPALRWNLRRRVRLGKEEAARLPEREGHGAARPEGRLLWLHAASVGETLAILPLLDALLARDPALSFLVTTGTATSAQLLPQRLSGELGARVIHRYVPLDVPPWVARFLDGWRPDAACLVESELWPNLLGACAARGIPTALLNARISGRSFRRWRNFGPGLIRRLLGGFSLIVPRSAEDAARLTALGARRLAPAGDLKLAADPLPADPGKLAELRAAIGARPVLLAASTHPGEEELVLAAARELAPRVPDLLTIIVPRHPERGSEIAAAAGAPRRGAGLPPGEGPAYIADTLGELGLFYRLASVALVGGSLIRHGGQNPLEAARLGCPMILGPHMENFADATAALLAAGGARQLPDAAALAGVVADMLSHPERAAGLVAGATRVVSAASDLPGRLAVALLDLLPGKAAGKA